MKNFLFTLLVLLAVNVMADDTRIPVSSDVKSVKFFLNGAQVERTVRTSVDAGQSIIAFEGLSSQIDQSSILVNGTGDAMIMGVNFSLDYLKDKKKSPELKLLEDSLKSLQKLLEIQNMNESVFNDELGLINANKNTSGSNVGVNAENLKKVADFYRQRSIEIKTKLIDIHDQQKKLNERIAKINDQLNEWNGKLNTPYGTILVTVNAGQHTNINMTVSYYVNAASWYPLYELHGVDVKNPIELTYKAAVKQWSGENWDKVKVILSTGNPSVNNTKPALAEWYLDFFERYRRDMMQKESMAPAPAMINNTLSMGDVSLDSQQMGTYTWTVSENAVTTEFEVKEDYTIPSDQKDVIMTIDKKKLPAEFSYYTVPKLDKDAFLMASITGWEQLNLLPGKANIYFENSYVGEAYINPAATTDTLRLSMGRDKRIVIRRDKLKDLSSVKVLGSNTVKQYVFEITIRNTRSENISLVIEDQVPLTRNADIKISVDELSKADYKEEKGLVTWRLDLKPGETRKLRLGYTVKYPKDKVVSGLE
ncbi:MAG: DUF4139 domain-containing protein [Bacteroidia bacterium]